MAHPTISQLKDRIVTLCAEIPGIETALDDYPENNEPFAFQELPAIVVRVGAAVHVRQTHHQMFTTRQFGLIFHADRLNDDSQEPDTEALESIEEWLLTLMVFFNSRRRLEHNNDAGLAVDTLLSSDSAPQRIIKEGAVYIGSIFTLSVDTRHNV